MEEVSKETADSKLALLERCEGGGKLARLVLRASLKSLKSMPRKSWVGGLLVRGMERSMVERQVDDLHLADKSVAQCHRR